ncbi:hypothetical protein CEXT_68651, partial [Caerostris extrusa]
MPPTIAKLINVKNPASLEVDVSGYSGT